EGDAVGRAAGELHVQAVGESCAGIVEPGAGEVDHDVALSLRAAGAGIVQGGHGGEQIVDVGSPDVAGAGVGGVFLDGPHRHVVVGIEGGGGVVAPAISAGRVGRGVRRLTGLEKKDRLGRVERVADESAGGVGAHELGGLSAGET